MKKISILAIILTGCAAPATVLKMGPETYRISTTKEPIFGGAPAAESEAITMANKHCESLNKEILVTNTSTSFNRPIYNFTVDFQCLFLGDKKLQSPTYQRSPDLIIEQRTK